MVGGYVDPVKIQGPRLGDAAKQTSQEGVVIPFGYAKFPVMGNVIWAGPLVEHKHKDSGKGGPVNITYTYSRSYAIGICEGPIVGLILVKRNGKIVYDTRPDTTTQALNGKFRAQTTIYPGDETQNADPTIESYEGAGEVEPNRGLCYIVVEDDDLTDSQGAIPQYEFVVQTCGTSYDSNVDRIRFIAVGSAGNVAVCYSPDDWTERTPAVASGYDLRGVAHGNSTYVAVGDAGTDNFVMASVDTVNWTETTPSPNPGADGLTGVAYGGHGRFVIVGKGVGASPDGLILAGNGYSWGVAETPAGSGWITSVCYGGGLTDGRFVAVTSTGNAVVSSNGTLWSKWATGATNLLAVRWTGAVFLAVGDNGETYFSTDGTTWSFGSSPGGGDFSFQCVTGGYGPVVAGTNNGTDGRGIYASLDLGVTWIRQVSGGAGTYYSACFGEFIYLVGSTDGIVYSSIDGFTWVAESPIWASNDSVFDLQYIGPDPDWIPSPDGGNIWIDTEGNIITNFGVSTITTDCTVILGDIVADLCAREGLDASEYDVTELTDVVDGYRCATEAGADAFIQPLMNGHFFDKGEWDGKLWFPKRGRASIASLTIDDLAMRDAAPIEITRIQEAELLRKLNLMTIDPSVDYSASKQTAERRIGTIHARSEQTEEMPLVADVDKAAKIVDIRMKIGWAEPDKFKFSLPYKFSRLTPTDVIHLTDINAINHRIRLMASEEDGGVIFKEASKDRQKTYTSSAVGSRNTNTNPHGPGIVGPTLFEAMNLPQLRTEDNVPGMYIAACGMLDSWTGCSVLLSVDGGVSYTAVKNIMEASTMGYLTQDISDSATDSSGTIRVRVYGGDLSNATTAQVATGVNAFAITSAHIAEVGNFETAIQDTSGEYELSQTQRGLLETIAVDHAELDPFVMLGSVYFLPIDVAFAGQLLYFKAVGFGTSPDAAPIYTVVYEPPEYILDGGGA